MHATLQKFGWPATLLREFEHWCILLRPQQATYGALVLCAKSEATAFSDLQPAAFAELADATRAIERTLKNELACDKINYLMLMMVDPHVHFHVLPRYANPQEFAGHSFTDPGWPGLPDLKHTHTMADAARAGLLHRLQKAMATPA
jgi:diadenosine tetraphosphate (Ap4A) HIT family hydrolase